MSKEIEIYVSTDQIGRISAPTLLHKDVRMSRAQDALERHPLPSATCMDALGSRETGGRERPEGWGEGGGARHG